MSTKVKKLSSGSHNHSFNTIEIDIKRYLLLFNVNYKKTYKLS